MPPLRYTAHFFFSDMVTVAAEEPLVPAASPEPAAEQERGWWGRVWQGVSGVASGVAGLVRSSGAKDAPVEPEKEKEKTQEVNQGAPQWVRTIRRPVRSFFYCPKYMTVLI